MAFGSYRVDFSKHQDATLGEVFGKKPITSAAMTKALWDFVKANGLGGKVSEVSEEKKKASKKKKKKKK